MEAGRLFIRPMQEPDGDVLEQELYAVSKKDGG